MKTVKHFVPLYPNLKIKQPLVLDWVKNETKWQGKWESSMVGRHTIKQACQTQHPEVTEMMDLWVSKAMWDKVVLTGEVL
jgi:hypothetical protein